MVSVEERFRGCLLGGAVGDALGAPVEFLSRAEIVERFGPDGIVELAEAYGRVGSITDDTQMAMFTAEGMIPAVRRAMAKGIWGAEPSFVYHAYRYWLRTQGEPLPPVPKMHGLSFPVGASTTAGCSSCPSCTRAARPGEPASRRSSRGTTAP